MLVTFFYVGDFFTVNRLTFPPHHLKTVTIISKPTPTSINADSDVGDIFILVTL